MLRELGILMGDRKSMGVKKMQRKCKAGGGRALAGGSTCGRIWRLHHGEPDRLIYLPKALSAPRKCTRSPPRSAHQNNDSHHHHGLSHTVAERDNPRSASIICSEPRSCGESLTISTIFDVRHGTVENLFSNELLALFGWAPEEAIAQLQRPSP